MGVYAEIHVDPFIDSALVCLVKQEYGAAEDLLEAVLDADSDNIDALYLLVTVRQTMLLDYESYTVEGDSFLKLADEVLARLEAYKPSAVDDEPVKLVFYMGNIIGGKGLIQAKNDKWFGAVKNALKSVSLLSKVRERDSTFYAAYLGLGVFNYYLSQNLKWAPFMGDKSREGLRDIEKSTRARFPFNYAAKNSLAWILIDRQNYRRADSIVSSVLADYPDNTIFLRIKSRIKLWTHQNEEARDLGMRMAELAYQRSPVNWSDFLSGYQVAAEGCVKMGREKEGRAIAEKALRLEIPASARKIPYVREHLDYFRSLSRNGAAGEGR
jgi:hypothetical protein